MTPAHRRAQDAHRLVEALLRRSAVALERVELAEAARLLREAEEILAAAAQELDRG